MSPPPLSPSKQSAFVEPNLESEWEYEYDPTETEDFYITLDVSTHSSSLGRLRKQRDQQRKQRSESVNPVIDTQIEEDETETPGAPLNHDETLPEPTPPAEEDLPERIQILDLHSKNPLISYQGRLHSCNWSKPRGTDVLLKASSSLLQDDLQDGADEVSPIVAWSDFRLMAMPVELVPHIDDRRSKDGFLADGARIPSTTTSSPHEETVQQAVPIVRPTEQVQQSQHSPRALHSDAISASADQQSTPEDIQSRVQKGASPTPQLPPNTTNDPEHSGNHSTPRLPQFPTSNTSDHDPMDFSASGSIDLTAPSVSKEIPLRTASISPQEPTPPSLPPPDALSQPPPLNPLTPTTPLSIPLPSNTSLPRLNQASFLTRLSAAKRSRGETDQIPIYTKKICTGTSWRLSQRETKAQEAALIEENDNNNNNNDDDDEDVTQNGQEGGSHDEAVGTRERRARGRVRRAGFTEKGKKIGRPRTEAFGGGRGRGYGRGRGRPRLSRGGRMEVENTSPRNKDMEIVERGMSASPNDELQTMTEAG